MEFTLQREYNTDRLTTGNYTFGVVTNKEKTFRAFCLEDDFHEVKIKRHTRIPAGRYEFILRDFVTDSLHRHRISLDSLPWFKVNPDWHHIEVSRVPGFQGILVHPVGDDAHTEGCLGYGYSFDMTLTDNQMSKSKLAINDFYAIVHPLLKGGGRAWITIIDEP